MFKVWCLAKEPHVKKSVFERSLSIIVIILIFLTSISVIYWYQNFRFPIIGGDSNNKIFYISGTMWEFYPSEISVDKGDNVTIHFTSLDVHHGLYIKKWNVTADLFINQSATIHFIADEVGKFEYYCTVYCGIEHTDMKGYIIVKDN